MGTMTIDGRKVEFTDEKNVLTVIRKAGINIPTLCYHSEVSTFGACRLCTVEDDRGRTFASCSEEPRDGMVIYTNSGKIKKYRKLIVELLLAAHCRDCTTCVKSGECVLQELAHRLGVHNIRFQNTREQYEIDDSSPSLIRDPNKCILCGDCVRACEELQGIGALNFAYRGTEAIVIPAFSKKIAETQCVNCGQCRVYCPTGAISIKTHMDEAWEALADPNIRVVAQVAPAVRAAWGEALGLSREEATVGKIMDALKKMGIDYVFDTSFTADLTIMEEGNEFLQRFTKGELNLRPMFTSCCPGWVRFLKSQYPHLVPQLSTAKSPQQMFGSVMKSYFAESIGVKPENMFTVSIMPCVAKKGESNMELFYGEYAGHETDVVLTTRELTRMIRSAHIDPASLVDRECDPLMKEWTGAGVIFGTTGGVMEAALRSAHYLVTGRNPDPDAFKIVRNPGGQPGVVEAEIQLGDATVRAAVVSGLGNTRKLIEAIEHGEVHYDFVEVMACPGGCVGGGGQPIHDGEELARTRGENLYFLDKNAPLRFSHENPDVLRLYRDFLEKPLSHKSHMLLHTDHNAWEMPR